MNESNAVPKVNESVVPDKQRQVNLGTFTNSSGVTFQIRGLAPLEPQRVTQAVEDRWKKSGKWDLMQPPTYEVELVGGGKQVFKHDENSVKEAGPEIEAAFLRSSLLKQEFDNELNMRVMRAAFQCLMTNPLEDKDWLDRMTFNEVEIPENRAALKALYVETEVLASPDDIARLMTAVLTLAGTINEETAKAAEATFRSQIQGAINLGITT